MFGIGSPLLSVTDVVMVEVVVPSFLMFCGVAVIPIESTIVSSVIRTASNGIVCPKEVSVSSNYVKKPVNVRKFIHGIPTVSAFGF